MPILSGSDKALTKGKIEKAPGVIGGGVKAVKKSGSGKTDQGNTGNKFSTPSAIPSAGSTPPPPDESAESPEQEASEEGIESCDCGEPGCKGCIVGAMKSPKAMNSFVKSARAGYKSSKGV